MYFCQGDDKMPKISIIIPVYNKGKYVRKAIESILSQTFTDWELIIVDDGSTDSSYSICLEYTNDKRVKVYHMKNGGVSRARNKGLDYAQGEYVTFIDSDDYISEDYLEKLYHPGYEMIIGGLTKVNYKGEVMTTVLPSLCGEKKITEMAVDFYKEQIHTGIYGFVSSKLIRRNVIEEKHLRFDERIKLAEDYDFYLKIYQVVDKAFFIHYAGYYYLQGTENSAIVLKDDKVDFFIQAEIQQKTKQFLEKLGCFGKEEEEIYINRLTGYVYTILLVNSRLSYGDFLLLFVRLKREIPDVTGNVTGIEKWCINQYKKNRKMLIFLYLKLRVIMRK